LVVAGYFPSDREITDRVGPLAGAALALGAALVGVVVAGLAVVVALLDDELLELMDRDEKSGRVPGHMFPYWFVAGTGVLTFLLALLLLLAQPILPPVVARVLFAATCAFVVWTALGVFNLVGSLQALGVNRATNVRTRPKP
jgi:drug/metabolite transporter (DMT)-like permease